MLALAAGLAASGCSDSDGEATTAPRAPAPEAQQPAGDGDRIRAVEIGVFPTARLRGSAAGPTTISTSSRRPAASCSSATASRSRSRSSTSPPRSTGYEQGLLSMAFAPEYERSGRFYVDYTDTEGDSHRRVPALGSPTPTSPIPERVSSSSSTSPSRTTTAASSVRARRPALRRARGRRWWRRLDAKRAGPGHPAREDPLRIDPRPAQATLLGPALQPVRRRPGCVCRDLLLRAAQPVALLVRPRDGLAVDQ